MSGWRAGMKKRIKKPSGYAAQKVFLFCFYKLK